MSRTHSLLPYLLISALLHAGLYWAWLEWSADAAGSQQASASEVVSGALDLRLKALMSQQAVTTDPATTDHGEVDADVESSQLSELTDLAPVPRTNPAPAKPVVKKASLPTPVKPVSKLASKPKPKQTQVATKAAPKKPVAKKQEARIAKRKPQATPAQASAQASAPPAAVTTPAVTSRPSAATAAPIPRQGALTVNTGSTGEQADIGRLLKAIRQAVDEKKRYPLIARRSGRQGTTTVGFLLHEDGRFEDIDILHSSGYRPLDKAALKAVQAVNPFPGAARYLREARRMQLKIAFVLR